MKLMLTTALTLAVAGGAAHAQLPDVTGQVRGTVDSATQVETDVLDRRTMVDQRSGLEMDARLISNLNNRLAAHSMAEAQGTLRSELQSNARAYAHAPEPRASARAGVHADTRSRLGTRHHSRAHAGGNAYVYVYTRDGYKVGHVHRDEFDQYGRLRVQTSADSDARIGYVQPDYARFNSEANAVVLTMTRAEFENVPMTGS